MKRTQAEAELDAPLSSPSPKRRAYESSTASSVSSYHALEYPERRPPEEDDEDPNSPSVDSSASGFFQLPVGPDPNDSQEDHYDSDADSRDSDMGNPDSKYIQQPAGADRQLDHQLPRQVRDDYKSVFGHYPTASDFKPDSSDSEHSQPYKMPRRIREEYKRIFGHYPADSISRTDSSDAEHPQRPVGPDPQLDPQTSLKTHEDHKRIFGSRPRSTNTESESDTDSNPESVSSTSASISDDVSGASSSDSADNDQNPSSSSSSGSSSSPSPAPARSNPSPPSSSALHAPSHSPSDHPPHHSSPSPSISPSASPLPSSTTQLSTANLSKLQSRLNTLLPALKSANQALEIEKAEGRLGERDIENVTEEEGGRCIEMELGLGVLEEKGKGEEEEGRVGDVMGRLIGKKGRGKGKGKGRMKTQIEEVAG